MAYYFLGRYNEAVDACDRALSRNPGRNTQMLTHPMLAAIYAELGRQQDAEGENAPLSRVYRLPRRPDFRRPIPHQEARTICWKD
jgi:hypothetical protein